jgi:hypothetical protein
LTSASRANRDQVGLALLQDVLGAEGIDDQADRHRHDAGLAAHALRIGHLEAPAALDARCRRRADEAAGGAIDHVDTAGFQLFRIGHGIVHGPAAFQPVDGGDAQEYRLVLRPCRAHGFRDLEGKARAPGKVAAVGIVALVGDRRKERVHQVTVRIVDLEDVEARLQRTLGGIHPVALEGDEIGDGELPWHDKALGHGLGRRRDDVPGLLAARQVLRSERSVAEPGPLHGALAAGMRDLDAGHHALGLHEGGDARERRNVRRRPDAEVAVGDAALVGHGGGLDEHARGAPEHQPAPMREMKILGDAVHRRVGRHRGDDDSVFQRHLADGDGREEQRLGHRRMRARGVRRAGSGAQQVRAGAVKSLAAGAL